MYGYSQPYSMQDKPTFPYAGFTPSPLQQYAFANDPALAQAHFLGRYNRSGPGAASAGFLDWLERQLPTYYKGYQAKATENPTYSWDQHMQAQNPWADWQESGFLAQALPRASRPTTFLRR